MTTLTITQGLPGSGKSYWANTVADADENTVIVNRDDLRAMLHNNNWNHRREKATVAARDALISTLLKSGKNVICSDTNLDPKVVAELTRIGKAHKAEVVIKDFTDVPLKKCIERDLKRSRTVGEKVIRDMYDRYLRPKPTEGLNDPNLPPCIIVDMDGTLALIGDRSPYDDANVHVDAVNKAVEEVIYAMTEGFHGITVIIMSGRDAGRSMEPTMKWLYDNEITYHEIHMRPAGDTRHDSDIKRELYMEHIAGKYYVQLVLDDRNQVVDLWRKELGLPCFQVGYGDF